MLPLLTRKVSVPALPAPELYCLLFHICFSVTAWPRVQTGANCPSAEWNAMCRPCCEYHLIQCRCPSKGSRVGYTVPCCRNALDQCDPCIIHPGCSLFENCKTCHNGTWRANDDFFVDGKYCTECRQGWSGGDCKTCGGVVQRAQGHIALESYPTNARCEWTVRAQRGRGIELRFSLLSLESDHSCRYDYVEVRDGGGPGAPVIGRFCGDRPPPPIRSSGNLLHVLFTSDGYNNFDGFVLTFQEISARGNPTCAAPDELANGYSLPVHGPEEELVSVNYRCHPPFVLAGSQERTCLPNGMWSGTVPTCVKGQTSRVRCAPPPKLLNGFHTAAPETAGDAETVEFFCKNSYVLSGSRRSACLTNGSWSSRPPKCVRACREPKVSELVRQRVVKPHRQSPNQRLPLSSRYDIHDLLSAGFVPFAPDRRSGAEGHGGAPGELPLGFHAVHTSVEYECASPLYRHAGSSRRTCLKSGRWSGRHVSCSPVCGKFDTFSPHNLSDTQWPWHAAVYVRGATAPGRRESSRESSSWSLSCSGALLTQRSVLVAAQCVADEHERRPLHPAHVKVVMQHRASGDRLKSQHHLRVSDILVHPNFYSAPDSNVAVLKLKDKAKISERVLPVCLPRMQGGEVTAQKAYAARWMLPPPPPPPPNDRGHVGRTELVELSDVAHCEKELARGGTRAAAIADGALCVVRTPPGPEGPCRLIPGFTTLPAASPSTARTGGASATSWQLLGVESFSYEEGDCHRHTRTVQTRIGNFRDWIEKNMN